jgi:murein DD-endopeptidase MepM/ murein hydrolase activator NlpD
MSRRKYPALFLFIAVIPAIFALFINAGRSAAQSGPSYQPAGGGEAPVSPTDEITDTERAAIQKEINGNISALEAEGLLGPASPQFVALSWPVRAAPGVTDFGVDGISNYVDHNPGFPGLVLDWNCGTRTYDQSSGYNHKGIDIFTWPFSWKKMDNNQVEIIAAAPGTIVGRFDGNFDRSCGFNSNPWNAVYVRHADGSIAWYGHMKNGSVTSKLVGDTVVAGEKLGNIGSSGNSTGPHLHFELYDPAGKLQDPFQGPCNSMNASSWWAVQEAYRAPRINRLMTQSAGPIFPGCSIQETTNDKTLFRPGQQMTTAAYYRDQGIGQQTQFAILRPDGSVFANWTHISPNTYTSSYWFWNWTVPPNPLNGTWKLRATFNSSEYEQEFTVDSNAIVSGQVIDPSGRGLRNAIVSLVNSQNVIRSVPSSSLGFYSFDNVPVGQTYELRTASRRYRFDVRPVTVNDNLSDINLLGFE